MVSMKTWLPLFVLLNGCDTAPGHLWCHPAVEWLRTHEGVGEIETCECEGAWENGSPRRPCVVETQGVRYHVTCFRFNPISNRETKCRPTWLGKNEDGERWYQAFGATTEGK